MGEDLKRGNRRASVGVLRSPTDGYGTDDEKKTNRRASLQGPAIRTRRNSERNTSRFKQLKHRRDSRRASGKGIDPGIVARLSFVAPGSDSSSSSSSCSIQEHHHYGAHLADRMGHSIRETSTRGSVRSRRPSNQHNVAKQSFKKQYSKKDNQSESEGSYGIDAADGRVPDSFGYESDAIGCESDMERSTCSKLARRRNSAQTIEKSIHHFKERAMLGDDDLVDGGKHSDDDGGKSPFRMSPLTISYAPPTEQALRDIARIQLDLSVPPKHNFQAPKQQRDSAQVPAEKDAWGMMELNDDFSDKKSSSNMSYGPSLYNNLTSSEEVDKYKQKARRRDSLVDGCIDMDLESMKQQVPQFTPAEGCYNASDFIVRCFTARLRTVGFTVLKHNRSRWSKSTNRVLFLCPDGRTLSWRPTDEEMQKNKDKGTPKHPKIDLRTCLEVRHAWTKDPSSHNKRGTSVLRSRLSENHLASKSLSLVFKSRTLDVTAFSNDQCKVMMEGFSALCFRLQLREREDSSHTFSKPPNEDDWASTIYASTSVSATNTSSTMMDQRASHEAMLSTPWGL